VKEEDVQFVEVKQSPLDLSALGMISIFDQDSQHTDQDAKDAFKAYRQFMEQKLESSKKIFSAYQDKEQELASLKQSFAAYKEKMDVQHKSQSVHNGVLQRRIPELEGKIKTLEGELQEKGVKIQELESTKTLLDLQIVQLTHDLTREKETLKETQGEFRGAKDCWGEEKKELKHQLSEKTVLLLESLQKHQELKGQWLSTEGKFTEILTLLGKRSREIEYLS